MELFGVRIYGAPAKGFSHRRSGPDCTNGSEFALGNALLTSYIGASGLGRRCRIWSTYFLYIINVGVIYRRYFKDFSTKVLRTTSSVKQSLLS